MVERRQFSRVIYQVPTEISQGQVNVSGSVQDLSFNAMNQNNLAMISLFK